MRATLFVLLYYPQVYTLSYFFYSVLIYAHNIFIFSLFFFFVQGKEKLLIDVIGITTPPMFSSCVSWPCPLSWKISLETNGPKVLSFFFFFPPHPKWNNITFLWITWQQYSTHRNIQVGGEKTVPQHIKPKLSLLSYRFTLVISTQTQIDSGRGRQILRIRSDGDIGGPLFRTVGFDRSMYTYIYSLYLA